MKFFGLVLAILFVCAAVLPAAADTCLIQKRHTDEYYYGGVVSPATDTENEMWIGGKKMALLTPNRIIIIDAGNDRLVFANKLDSTYVETTLPFDWTNVVDEATVGLLARYRTEGTVKDTGKEKEILGRKCKLYEIESWIEDGGERFNDREERVWASTDLAIDVEAYAVINENGMRLQNYDDAFVEACSVIKGAVMVLNADVFQKGFSVNETEVVSKVIEKQPDTDVYSLPSYFKKKDKLSMADLRG